MYLKSIYIVIFSTAFYVAYHSNNSYVESLKNYIFDHLENVYNLKTLFTSNEPLIHDGSKIFTPEELAKFSNAETGLYLSILGKIYDVTNGAKFYGPGGPYNAFVGRDASLAFITGDFTETGLTDDLSSLSDKQIKQLKDWQKFYNSTYVYKGKLLGRYYDVHGNPTEEYRKIIKRTKRAEKNEKNEEEKNKMFPPCNIEWEQNTGTRVWCTENSGGITRDWIGVPRILFEKPKSKANRCACVNLKSKEYFENKGNIGEYKDCPKDATSCIISNVK